MRIKNVQKNTYVDEQYLLSTKIPVSNPKMNKFKTVR